MTAPVLIEGRNLAIKQGTGIASYARNLTQVLRGQGHELDVLFDTEFPLTPNQPEWNEIKLYDPSAGNRSIFARFRRFRRAGQYMAAAPFGVTASEIACTHSESDSLFPDLQGFARQQAVEMLFLRADWHVQRYGRRLAVKPLRQPKLMHATHPAAIEVKGCPNIYTVHDLVPLRLPHTTLDNKRAFLKTLTTLAKTADRIVTVSESSRRDIIKYLGVDEDRVVNTYQAVSLPERHRARPAEEKLREIAAFRLRPQRYFIFVGAVEPKKNIERLIDAYLSTGSRYPLVIVGKLGWDYERVVEKIESAAPLFSRRKAPPRQRIIHLPYLPFFQMLSLVENARAMLFPSLYEGFGLPVLEAMLLGTPVVAANTSSLPEVVGEAGLLADPYDSMAIGQAIRTIDQDDDLRAELSRRGPEQAAQFSPDRYSERVKALYDELL